VPNWGQLLSEDGGLPPPRVPGYTILELIGGHGQSEVYLAEDGQGRRVALKRWKLPSPRAQLELEALQSLRVPGVVAVLGSAEDEALGLPCLIMEYVEAPQLLASTPRLEARAAAAVVRDVARTLSAVHAGDLVHRDIKPANILLRENGSVVLVDFGVVKAGQEVGPEAPLTLTGAGPIGTLPYMAPEQLDLCEEPVGPLADVYALGATLYQCLTGVVPFETNGAFERRERRVWKDPPPGAVVEGIPAQLRRVVSACLAFRPRDRPESAASVARALDDFLAGRSGRPGSLGVLGGFALLAVGLAVGALLSARGQGISATPSSQPSSQPSSTSSASARASASQTTPTPAAPEHTVVLQPGPREGRDTYVSSVGLYTNDNFGPTPNLRVGFRGRATGQVGEYRALLAFDLARVPLEAELLEAELELYSRGPGFGSGPARLELRPVVASGPRTPWLEGTGRNDRLLDGVAWSGVARTRHPAASSNLPARSLPQVGALASVADVSSGHVGWVRFELGLQVRAWLRERSSNLGLVVSALAEPSRGHWRFASSDSHVAGERPRLRLRYRGSAPLSGPKLDPAAERRRAQSWLDEAGASDDPARAYEALTQAAALAPGWGRPYYERALLGERLGLRAMTRIDTLQCLHAVEPERRVEALYLLAEANLREGGLTSRRVGLILLAALGCDPKLSQRAAARFVKVYSNFKGSELGTKLAQERALGELTMLLEARARVVPEPKPGQLALTLGLALSCEALGDPRALGLYQEASRLAPHDSLVLALGAGRERASGRGEATRVRIHLALGQLEAARRRWRAAAARWPRDSHVQSLSPVFADK
jgi:eukaryotic-like serine/threonine-protein kinase